MKRFLLLLSLSVLFTDIVFSQTFHIFKGPTNNVGTMVVLLQEQGNNAYYYTLTSTDYYSDMSDMSESEWKQYMREEKSSASYLQRSGNNAYTGRYNDRVTWNLRLTYDEYDKTAKVVLTHPNYQSISFVLSEVGLDGYKLAKKERPATPSNGNCWSCHGAGKIMGMPCPSCGGSGTMNVEFKYDPNAVPVYPDAGGNVDNGGGTTPGGNTPSTSHQCRVCNGTGSEIYEPYTGSGRNVYCNICRRNFSHAHTHRQCKTCKGTGRVSY